ncbi:ABC transporter ATP-binding protein [Acidisoma cellulosilytica]|uniref:ABC transporter ATP-binding protein n=1 Tax=Acidisoma cellulosilyticum TaxID=2802395 RepID=A0A963YYS3_9PROT|nr:ABC transporter ATP-binding protein [Acidisoma cellulosilyticum]MCB8879249.1 ABC transporter ATP-binding protein [Acidisoma cellulosilyticum]
MSTAKPMLKADSVSKTFKVGSRFRAGGIQHLHALQDVSIEVYPGEIVGLVGESGCGKSTLGRCLLRLYDVNDGRITFKDRDITGLSQRELRPLRADMQMVFQDPYSSLNPRRRVGDLIAEPLRVHGKYSAGDIQTRLRELMDLVNLSPDFLTRFPHEFSGGQRQRIGIARAIALSPSLIVADEPVSALDVSVQAQIVNLFMDLQEKLGLTYVFIAHDLSVVRQIATRTAVMYLGGIVELGETDRVLHRPAHPYTAALISAVPEPDPHGNIKARTILRGEPPSPTNPPSGCRFHTRCPVAQDRCSAEIPRLRSLGDNRSVACHFPLDGSVAAHA